MKSSDVTYLQELMAGYVPSCGDGVEAYLAP